MVRRAVGRLLEDEGYTVAYAEDGAKALEQLEGERPDAILLDVMMPGMNGREFLKALREREQPSIPVVVMTAIHGIDSQPVFALGAADLVRKPFDVDELLNKVALALFRSRGGDDQTDAEPARVEPPPPEPTPETREGVVLVIDDDRLTLRRLDAALSDRGYTTVSLLRVTDELPRLARVLEPAAVILDLRMPGIDGLTALRWLRAEQVLDDVPILVFSGSPVELEQSRAEIERLGAEVRSKPLDVDDLVAFVTQARA